MANLDSGEFEKLKKDDLLALGKHLHLDVRAAMKVEEVCSAVSQYLVKESAIKEGDPAPSSHRPELSEKYKYKLGLKKLEYQRERKRKGSESAKRAFRTFLLAIVKKRCY